MSIDQKYFPTDKNYLLKTVQAFSKDSLLDEWTKQAYNGYMTHENPMGLEDDFTLTIKTKIRQGVSVLDESYDLLAAIFRYKYGDNQLSFLWDGRTHMEYYDELWRDTYLDWTRKLCLKPEIYRSIIKASIATQNMNIDFLKMSVKRAVLKSFKVRISRAQKLHAMSA